MIEVKRNFVLLLLLAISLFTACNQSSGISFDEIDISSIKGEKVNKLLQDWQHKNGAYLFQYQNQGKKNYYIFFNASNIEQGNKALYFDGLRVNFEDTIMYVHYSEKQTDNLNNGRNKALYKIRQSKGVDTIKIYKNGQETYFEKIGAIEE
jgi:hypothetical protein